MDLVFEYYQIIDQEHVAKRAFILLVDKNVIMMACLFSPSFAKFIRETMFGLMVYFFKYQPKIWIR